MKKTLFALTVFLLALNAQAQNDTMYIMKDGAVINQYSMHKSDVDSIVFYEPLQTVTDIEGNVYRVVIIGDQFWMAENLKTTKYNDGTSIPNVTDATAWSQLATGSLCDYNNTPKNSTTYGKLYNWYAVNTGKLCPIDWHVSTDAEWKALTTYLGGETAAVGKLKEIGTTHWRAPNERATNETGFTALPGGYRNSTSGEFDYIGVTSDFWTATESQTLETDAWYRRMTYEGNKVHSSLDKKTGFSVRCLKD